MQISNKGLELIQEWEGVEPMVYLDAAGLPTIGCGHLLSKAELSSGKILLGKEYVKYSSGLSSEQIMTLLRQDLAGVQECINESVKIHIGQNQFDALCSFAFNVGIGAFKASTLRKLLNQGYYASVPNQLRRWVRSAGRIVQGLVNRRENEIKLFEGVI